MHKSLECMLNVTIESAPESFNILETIFAAIDVLAFKILSCLEYGK